MKKILPNPSCPKRVQRRANRRPNHAINLTDVGKTQAQRLADWLVNHISEPVTEIFVSQYLRTQQRLNALSQSTKRTATIIDELYEFNFLDFDTIKDCHLMTSVIADDFGNSILRNRASELTDSLSISWHGYKSACGFDRWWDVCWYLRMDVDWRWIWRLLLGDSPVMNMQQVPGVWTDDTTENCEVLFAHDNQTTITKGTRNDGMMKFANLGKWIFYRIIIYFGESENNRKMDNSN